MFRGGGHHGWRADLIDKFLKGTTQGLLWPILVTIGPVVSEEKIDTVFHIGSYVKLSPTVAAILDGGWTCRIIFFILNGPPKDYCDQVWFQ